MKRYLLVLLMALTLVLNAEYIEIEDNLNREVVEYNSRDLSALNISFNLKNYQMEEMYVKDTEYLHLSIPQEGASMDIGKPELPAITRFFAVPDEGEASFQINWSREKIISDQLIYPSQELATESSRAEIPFTIDEAFYQKQGLYPESRITVGEPVIMRDIRMVPVTFHPFQYNAASKELIVTNNIEITLSISRSGGSNLKTSDRKFSRIFENIYRSVVTNYDMIETRDLEYQAPSYLFIYPDDDQVEAYLQELMNWKHEKGFVVTAASLAETGNGQMGVLNYIQNAYDTWEDPPEYVCLVGDAAGAIRRIPTGHYVDPPYNGEGDHVYSTLEGDDILADVIIGRLSFNTLNEFLTILAKNPELRKKSLSG